MEDKLRLTKEQLNFLIFTKEHVLMEMWKEKNLPVVYSLRTDLLALYQLRDITGG